LGAHLEGVLPESSKAEKVAGRVAPCAPPREIAAFWRR